MLEHGLLQYGYTCCRNLFKNKSPVCKFHSKKKYTSYCYEWVVYSVPNHCESIGTTFEVLTFVVILFESHLVMTSKNYNFTTTFFNKNLKRCRARRLVFMFSHFLFFCVSLFCYWQAPLMAALFSICYNLYLYYCYYYSAPIGFNRFLLLYIFARDLLLNSLWSYIRSCNHETL